MKRAPEDGHGGGVGEDDELRFYWRGRGVKEGGGSIDRFIFCLLFFLGISLSLSLSFSFEPRRERGTERRRRPRKRIERERERERERKREATKMAAQIGRFQL